MAKAEAEGTAIVFDFDSSFIDANTDTWGLSPAAQALQRELRQEGKEWPQIMSAVFAHVAQQEGKDPRDAMADIPTFPAHSALVSSLRDREDVDIFIVSNGNTSLISRVLEQEGILDAFTRVIATPGVFDPDSGILSVDRYHVDDHGCSSHGFCPPMMCKGAVIDEIVAERGAQYASMVYIGDSTGDYCALTRLQPDLNHIALVRKDRSLAAAVVGPHAAGLSIPPDRIFEWSSDIDTVAIIQSHVLHPASEPELPQQASPSTTTSSTKITV